MGHISSYPVRIVFIAAVFSISLFGIGGDFYSPSHAAKNTSKPEQIYLLRGFANVFSLGLDDIARKLKDRGIAVTIVNHSAWKQVSNRIKNSYKTSRRNNPIILIGHSLGALSIGSIARDLATANINVNFFVELDPRNTTRIPKNVKLAWRLRADDNFKLLPGAGFRGKIAIIDVYKWKEFKNSNLSHFNIDKKQSVQKLLIKQIVRLVRKRRRI